MFVREEMQHVADLNAHFTVTQSQVCPKALKCTPLHTYLFLTTYNMSNIDTLSINTIRALAADVTREANSGHPGIYCALICEPLCGPMSN